MALLYMLDGKKGALMLSSLYTRTPSSASIKRARKVADELIRVPSRFPRSIKGRGIVMCAGGYTYFTNAWITIKMLRHHGCNLPIQLWYLGSNELTDKMKGLVSNLGVECVDGKPFILRGSHIRPGVREGWVLKSVAIARSSFEEVVFLDADNLPVRDPSFLFDTPEYKTSGAIFWPDSSVFAHECLWYVFKVPRRQEPEFESGQLVVDKRINWEALALAERINFRADVFYRFMWGDKDTFRFAWHRLGRAFAMPKFPPQALQAADSQADMLCQHDFRGGRLFQHRMMYKWSLVGENPWIPGFFFERECRNFLEELKSAWDGRCRRYRLQSQASKDNVFRSDLVNTVWLIKIEKASPKKRPQKNLRIQSCCAPVDNSKVWTELCFNENGTFYGPGANQLGVFWDLKHSADPKLILRDESQRIFSLRKSNSGWHGIYLKDKVRRKGAMLPVNEVYPHLRAGSFSSFSSDQEIRRAFADEVHISHSAHGIGDHIVATFACAGLARKGVKVVFHSFHAKWLGRINEKGLTISSDMSRRADFDLEYDYGNQIRYGDSRASWYAGRLHPLLKPVRPSVERTKKIERFPFNRYVVVAPLATRASREWLDIHWTRLTHLLREAGYEVVAIGGRTDGDRLKSIFDTTQTYWVTSHPADWVIDAMLGAAAYIGVDNGMTHLAALMGVKTIAIHSQLTAEFLWPDQAVKSVSPDTKCVFCRWQPNRGWVNSCFDNCSALATVRPETVLRGVLDLVSGLPELLNNNRDHSKENGISNGI